MTHLEPTNLAPTNPRLKPRLTGGESLIGALVRIPSEDLIDMLGVAGFDFVVVDCEHGPADVLELRRHITVADLHGMGVLVRIGAGEDALALRALDQGAQGIIAPHVDDAESAQALVRAVHYPPHGHRGFATYPRAGGFGTVSARDHRSNAYETTLVIAMLESPAAVVNTEAILQTPGVDGRQRSDRCAPIWSVTRPRPTRHGRPAPSWWSTT
jgi:4-hydroxy-2-oxoheptanedioate aldolase